MVANAQHFFINSHNTVNEVLVDISGVQFRNFSRCQFVFVKEPLRVVDQVFVVWCPVRSLERDGFAMKYLPVAAFDIHYFDMTSYVVPVWYKILCRGNDDPDVAEDCLFDHIFSMRTDK